MKHWFTFLTLVLFSLSSGAQVIDKIVAVVGDKIVLKSDIEVQFMQYETQGELPPDFRCDIMNQMLVQKMLLTQAEIDSIAVTPEEIESELDRRIRHFVSMLGSQEKLEEYYQKSVLEIKEEFRPDIREQLLATRMQDQITGDVTITPAAVKKFFKSIPTDSLPYFNAEVEVGQIVLYPKPNNVQKQAALDKITKMRDEIIAGADFSTKAILYSDDPGTASKGGELPEFTRNDPYVPEFIGAAFKLKNGEISAPFETQFGYHIIQMIERKGDRVKARHILISPKLVQEDVNIIKRKLDSIRQLLVLEKISFKDAVAKFSEDEFTKNYNGMITNPQAGGETFFDLSQLGAYDRDIPFVIDTLDAGEYSSPFYFVDQQQQQGYRIIFLKSETKPHIANLQDDYAKIKSVAIEQKKQELMDEWMKEKIRITYIKIDQSYADCSSLSVWREGNP